MSFFSSSVNGGKNVHKPISVDSVIAGIALLEVTKLKLKVLLKLQYD